MRASELAQLRHLTILAMSKLALYQYPDLSAPSCRALTAERKMSETTPTIFTSLESQDTAPESSHPAVQQFLRSREALVSQEKERRSGSLLFPDN